jgi:hypothetical protein
MWASGIHIRIAAVFRKALMTVQQLQLSAAQWRPMVDQL